VDMRTTEGRTEPSIGELIRQLFEDVGKLIRTEIKLAQSEVKANAASLGKPLMLIAAGALLLLAALFTLMGAFVGWLADAVGPGWAAFIVAVVVGGIGVALVLSGRKSMSTVGLAPTRTIDSIRQDAEALKGRS